MAVEGNKKRAAEFPTHPSNRALASPIEIHVVGTVFERTLKHRLHSALTNSAVASLVVVLLRLILLRLRCVLLLWMLLRRVASANLVRRMLEALRWVVRRATVGSRREGGAGRHFAFRLER